MQHVYARSHSPSASVHSTNGIHCAPKTNATPTASSTYPWLGMLPSGAHARRIVPCSVYGVPASLCSRRVRDEVLQRQGSREVQVPCCFLLLSRFSFTIVGKLPLGDPRSPFSHTLCPLPPPALFGCLLFALWLFAICWWDGIEPKEGTEARLPPRSPRDEG